MKLKENSRKKRTRLATLGAYLAFMALPTTATIWLAVHGGEHPASALQGQLVALVGEALGIPLMLGSMAQMTWAAWLALIAGTSVVGAVAMPLAVFAVGAWLYGRGKQRVAPRKVNGFADAFDRWGAGRS